MTMIGEVGVVFGCTDPLLYKATYLNKQYEELLGVTWVIPLFRPGIVGLYVKPGVVGEPFHPNGRRERGTNDARRIAIEREFNIHMRVHKPVRALLVAHSDCKGHPVEDDQQRHDAVIAAIHLQERLRCATGFTGEVLAAMLSHGERGQWVLEAVRADQREFTAKRA
jgi:hypothetical protein